MPTRIPSNQPIISPTTPIAETVTTLSTESVPTTETPARTNTNYSRDSFETTNSNVHNNHAPVTNSTSNAGETTNVLNLLLNGNETNSVENVNSTERMTGPVPLAQGKEDIFYDGAFIGADGLAYDITKVNFDDIPPIMPITDTKTDDVLVYVNGLNSNKDEQAKAIQDLANATKVGIVGVHNATHGMFRDIMQSVGDKLNLGNNPPVDTLVQIFHEKATKGKHVHVLGHSQGGLIIARALKHLKKKLRLEDGMSNDEAMKVMGNIKVETFGQASATFPDGPEYVHYVNNKDPITQLFGLGTPFNSSFLKKIGICSSGHAGKDAIVHCFDADGDAFSDTHYMDVYLKKRVPFADARDSEFKFKDTQVGVG